MMSTSTGLRVLVADLVKRPGSTRSLQIVEHLGTLVVGEAELDDDGRVALDLQLERITEGIVVRGTLGATWSGLCARCLGPVAGSLEVAVDELYEREPLEGETYLLDLDSIDLEPLTRDALGLEIPLAPLCRDDCAGLCPTCGIDRNVAACECRTDESDSRWAGLANVRFDDDMIVDSPADTPSTD
jgi:uncharacterized protein